MKKKFIKISMLLLSVILIYAIMSVNKVEAASLPDGSVTISGNNVDINANKIKHIITINNNKLVNSSGKKEKITGISMRFCLKDSGLVENIERISVNVVKNGETDNSWRLGAMDSSGKTFDFYRPNDSLPLSCGFMLERSDDELETGDDIVQIELSWDKKDASSFDLEILSEYKHGISFDFDYNYGNDLKIQGETMSWNKGDEYLGNEISITDWKLSIRMDNIGKVVDNKVFLRLPGTKKNMQTDALDYTSIPDLWGGEQSNLGTGTVLWLCEYTDENGNNTSYGTYKADDPSGGLIDYGFFTGKTEFNLYSKTYSDLYKFILYRVGDCYKDGVLNINDVYKLRTTIVQSYINADEDLISLCDCDMNGILEIRDVYALRKCILNNGIWK